MSYGRKISKERKNELYKQVAPIADEFRKTCLQEDGPLKDTFEILERLGYLFVCFPVNNDLSGFYIKKGDYHCIFVNSAHSLGRQYFSAWHECYHAYTGEIGGISILGQNKYDEVEQKADYFASCVLMPETLIKRYLRTQNITDLNYISYAQLIRMQNYFMTSYSALIFRLIELYPQYKATLKQRWSLSFKDNAEKMLRKIRECGGNPKLVKPTNTFLVNAQFYKNIHDNLVNDRISYDKAESIMKLLEEVKKKYDK